jgi:hypothetical protein
MKYREEHNDTAGSRAGRDGPCPLTHPELRDAARAGPWKIA